MTVLTNFHQFLSRPLFALINLGWHVTTPLAPFIFDNELINDFPGPWVSKHRATHFASQRQEDIVLEERPSSSISYTTPDGGGGWNPQHIKVSKNADWTEIHNPLPATSLDDEREYHQIPL